MLNKIAVIGEAWGEAEERARAPFVGPSGYELTKMLNEANIKRADCFMSNVFNFRPRGNNIETLCSKLPTPGLSALVKGLHLKAEYLPELSRLKDELRAAQPNLIIALGNTASWALLGTSGISKIRGTVTSSLFAGGVKTIPTYHPAAIMRQWELRAVTVLDLRKAERESHFPEIRRPKRRVIIDPSLSDMEDFYNEHIIGARYLAFDIETSGRQITCISFAPSTSEAIVVQFSDNRKASGSYWPNAVDERAAWEYVRKVLNCPVPKVGQNGLYDITYLWKEYGITVCNYQHDTMLAHHSLLPESEKSLSFMGSVYTEESSWKLMNRKGKETLKQEE